MKHPDVVSYARGLDLSAAERDGIEAHLKGCAECRDYVVFIRKVNIALRPSSRQPQPAADMQDVTPKREQLEEAERLAEALVSEVANYYDSEFLRNPSYSREELHKFVEARRSSYKERFGRVHPLAFDLQLNRWFRRKRLTDDMHVLAKQDLGISLEEKPQQITQPPTPHKSRPKPLD